MGLSAVMAECNCKKGKNNADKSESVFETIRQASFR